MRGRALCRSLLAIGFLVSQASAGSPLRLLAEDPPAFLEVTGAEGFQSSFREGVGLYLHGRPEELQLAADAPAELGRWLQREHPNWVVYLTRLAEGEEFVDPQNGRRSRDFAAVHERLGAVLSASHFSELRDARTGEANGAMLIVSFDRDRGGRRNRHRDLAYRAAEIYDRRGLGERAWRGRLDRVAIARLRERDTRGAIRATIRTIESRLSAALEREAADRRLVAQNAAREVENAAARLDELEGYLARFRRENPSVEGAMVRPGLEKLRARLASARSRLELEDWAAAGQHAREIAESCERSLELLVEHGVAREDLARASARLASLGREPGSPAIAQELAAARDRLEAAERAWSSGDPDYPRFLREGQTALRRAVARQEEFQVFERELERLEEVSDRQRGELFGGEARALAAGSRERLAELRQGLLLGELDRSPLEGLRADLERSLELSERARAQRRRNWLLIAGLALLALVGLALQLARSARRRRQARSIAQTWDATLLLKFQELLALDERKATLLGAHRQESLYPEPGETHELAEDVFDDVNLLYISHGEASARLRRAEALLAPRSLGARLATYLSVAPAERALALLAEKKIELRADSPLRVLVRGEEVEGSRLWEDIREPRPVSLSFEELIAQFDGLTRRTVDKLERVQTASLSIAESLASAETLVASLRARLAGLEVLGEEDELFIFERARDQYLPALESELAVAARLSRPDPVRARTRLERFRTAVTAVRQLLDLLLEERRGRLAELRATSRSLRQGGRPCPWIRERLETLSTELDAGLAAAAPEEGRWPALALPPLVARVDRLVEDVGRAERLARSLDESLPAEESAAAARLEEARSELGRALGLTPELLIREGNDEASRLLLELHRLHREAGQALGEGELDAADREIEQHRETLARLEAIISESLEAERRHAGRMEAAGARIPGLDDSLERARETLADLQQRFAPTALRLEVPPGDRIVTVPERLGEIDDLRAPVSELLADATASRARGAVLAAGTALAEVESRQETSRALLEELARHARRLDELLERNAARLLALAKRRREVEALAARDFVRPATNETLGEVGHELSRAEELSRPSAPGRPDPLAATRALDRVEEGYRLLPRLIERDERHWREARAAIEAAAREWGAARELADEAGRDAVPDSEDVELAARSLAPLAERLDRLRRDFGRPASDWPELDRRAERLAAEATELKAILRQELDAGREALERVSAARRAVRQSLSWSGPYGITADFEAGVLDEAQRRLEAGDYATAGELADRARRRAEQALEEAESEVRRERRRRRRRAESARRRSASSSSSLFSSSSGSSIGSSSSISSSLGGFSSGGSSSSGFSSSGGHSSSSSGFSSSGGW